MTQALSIEDTPLVRCTGIVKIFQVADLEVVALQGLDLEIQREEILALMGPSGSGKSTLLNSIGGLDRPSAGRMEVDGQNLLKYNQSDLTAYRREQVGFVWQQTSRNLLPYLSSRDNIELLIALTGHSFRVRRQTATELLDAVNMLDFARQRPTQLSGGQQQRIAIACALANRPKILLADEPTGELDWDTAQRILDLFQSLRERYGLTIIVVTHDPRVAEQADRVVAIRDGRLSTERRNLQVMGGGRLRNLAHAPKQRVLEEYVVVDSAGRLQLPHEQRTLAKIGRRVRVEVTAEGLLVRPDPDGDNEENAVQASAFLGDVPPEELPQRLYGNERLSRSEKRQQPRRSWWPWARRRDGRE